MDSNMSLSKPSFSTFTSQVPTKLLLASEPYCHRHHHLLGNHCSMASSQEITPSISYTASICTTHPSTSDLHSVDHALFNGKSVEGDVGGDDAVEKLEKSEKYEFIDKYNSMEKYNDYHYECNDGSLGNSIYNSCGKRSVYNDSVSNNINNNNNDYSNNRSTEEIVYFLEAPPPWKQALSYNKLSLKQRTLTDRPVSAFEHFSYVDDQVVLDEVKTSWNAIGWFQ